MKFIAFHLLFASTLSSFFVAMRRGSVCVCFTEKEKKKFTFEVLFEVDENKDVSISVLFCSVRLPILSNRIQSNPNNIITIHWNA
jgi:hypothetical protein